VRNEQGIIRQPIRFQGQYHDEETGLYYNRFRFYDPLQGRYITQDPIEEEGGFNFYAYVRGDPLNYIDPLGLFHIYGKKIHGGDTAGQYRFTMTFSDQKHYAAEESLKSTVKVGNKPMTFLLRQALRRIPSFAVGDRDVKGRLDRLKCVGYDNTVKEMFNAEGYEEGMSLGTFLTEDELSAFLDKVELVLPEDVVKLYDFDTLIQRAKERAQ
jgi:RHS repeat-associated protein